MGAAQKKGGAAPRGCRHLLPPPRPPPPPPPAPPPPAAPRGRRCPPVLGTLPAGATAWPSTPLPDPCQEDAVTTMNDVKPGDALFHGTSTPRWQSIQQDGALRLPSSGYRKISLTTDRSVAEY